MIKNIVIYFAKKYALDAIKDAVKANALTIVYWANKIGVWIAYTQKVLAYLESLRKKLLDGVLDQEEAAAAMAEAETLAIELKGIRDGASTTAVKAVVICAVAAITTIGCTSMVTIRLDDTTGTNIGQISVQEEQWPIISSFTGPRFTAKISKDCTGAVWAEGEANLTNSTQACGIYDSTEAKSLQIKMGFNTESNKTEKAGAELE